MLFTKTSSSWSLSKINLLLRSAHGREETRCAFMTWCIFFKLFLSFSKLTKSTPKKKRRKVWITIKNSSTLYQQNRCMLEEIFMRHFHLPYSVFSTCSLCFACPSKMRKVEIFHHIKIMGAHIYYPSQHILSNLQRNQGIFFRVLTINIKKYLSVNVLLPWISFCRCFTS